MNFAKNISLKINKNINSILNDLFSDLIKTKRDYLFLVVIGIGIILRLIHLYSTHKRR